MAPTKHLTYEIQEVLSESGKSRVYRAKDTEGHLLVVKHLKGCHDVYTQLQNISHPFLPRIYEVTVTEDETMVLEEFIDGAGIVQAGLNERQIRKAMLELCQVLSFLHQRGIIHRDIKPSNLLMAADGHIRLIDFDASRTIKEDQSSDTQLLGTKGYAPPEQYGFAQTDQRTDIYAVGITLQVLLGPLSRKRRNRKVIKKCTALDPERRYRSVDALRLSVYRGLIWRRGIRPLLILCLLLPALFIGLIVQDLLLHDGNVTFGAWSEIQAITVETGKELQPFFVRQRVFSQAAFTPPTRPFSFGTTTYDIETGSIAGFLVGPIPITWRRDGVGAAYDLLAEECTEHYHLYIDRLEDGRYVFGELKGAFNARSGTIVYREFLGLELVDTHNKKVQRISPADCGHYPDEMGKLYWMDVFDTPIF